MSPDAGVLDPYALLIENTVQPVNETTEINFVSSAGNFVADFVAKYPNEINPASVLGVVYLEGGPVAYGGVKLLQDVSP